MNQADLLEKLDMIKEAVERNPEQWWRELECKSLQTGQMLPCKTPRNVFDALNYPEGFLRLKPQRVRVEGWVDATLLEEARAATQSVPNLTVGKLAQALLDCVKEESDG